MSIFNTQRKFKEQTRVLAVDFPPRKNAWFMPAAGAKCVLLGRETGMIDDSSQLNLVERHAPTAKKLIQTLEPLNLNYTLHQQDLATTKITDNLDYIWIDLNGTITIELAQWITQNLSPKLMPGAVVCLTHEYCWRNNQWLKEIWQKQQGFEYTSFRFDRGIYSDKYLTFPPYLVHCLLRNWQLKMVGQPFRYADRTLDRAAVDMMFYRFIAEKPCVPVFPVIVPERKTSCPLAKGNAPMKTTVPSAAAVIEAIFTANSPAHKAHATRKLNAYVAQKVKEGMKETQVRAAIAAHVTRRRKAA